MDWFIAQKLYRMQIDSELHFNHPSKHPIYLWKTEMARSSPLKLVRITFPINAMAFCVGYNFGE